MKMPLLAKLIIAFLSMTILQISYAANQMLMNLNYRQGDIQLPGKIATIELNKYYYLDQKDAQKVLVEMWKNPPDSVKQVLGMIVPDYDNVASQKSWAVIISYNESGYVSDTDAASINYDQLLAEMKTQTEDTNKLRTTKNYSDMRLEGWAEPPHYDRTTHQIYWAKELSFSDQDKRMLNYSVKMLGRKGVLAMNGIAGIDQIKDIKTIVNNIVLSTHFEKGYRYEEFDPKADKVANNNVNALVKKMVARKMALLAKIEKVLHI